MQNKDGCCVIYWPKWIENYFVYWLLMDKHYAWPLSCMQQGLEAVAPRWTLLVWIWPLPSWTDLSTQHLDRTSCSQTTATNGCTRTRTTVKENTHTNAVVVAVLDRPCSHISHWPSLYISHDAADILILTYSCWFLLCVLFVFQYLLCDCSVTKGDINVHRNVERCSLPGYDPAVGCGRGSDPDWQISLFLWGLHQG